MNSVVAQCPSYPFSFDIRIDWAEVDPFGHVNNLAIMRYVQSTRVHAMEEAGVMDHFKAKRVGPILVSTSCQFKKQLYYPGQVQVRARVDKLGSTSFQLQHLILDGAGDVVAEALDILVFFDFNENAKCPIPEVFRERFHALGASLAK